MLFEQKERTFLGPAGNTEAHWTYLDRSGKPAAQRVRDFLERCIAEYPAEHRDRLIVRIRTTKNDSFQAATFELIIHALLKGLGCTVTVEPEIPNDSGKKPDFLAVTPQGDAVYVEATLAFADSPEERAMERRINGIYDALEKIHSPNFSVNVWVRATSASTPSETKLRRHVVEWLATLDPNVVFQQVITTHRGSFSEYRDGEWIIGLEAWGRPPERRGLGQRVVGIRHGNAGIKNDWGPIRKAIKKKGVATTSCPILCWSQ